MILLQGENFSFGEGEGSVGVWSVEGLQESFMWRGENQSGWRREVEEFLSASCC